MALPGENPLTDFATQKSQDTYKWVKALLCKWGVPHFIAQWIAAAAGIIIGVTGVYISYVTSLGIGLLGLVTKAIFELIGLVRKQGFKEIDELTIASLSELLGVELNPAHVKSGTSPEAQINSARAIGEQLHGRLFTEFTNKGKGTPGAGKAAAQAFTGYVTRFAMMNSLTSLIADTLSLHHVTQFRELGEEVARNLGLGRLHRRALTPLIDNAIAKPYDRELRMEFRQDHLSDVQFVRMYQAKRITQDQLRIYLAWKGYPDDMQDELVRQLAYRLTDTELETLLRYTGGSRQRLTPSTDDSSFGANDITPLTKEAAIASLVNDGLSDDIAKQRMVANALKRADADVSAYAAELENLAFGGWIDPESARLEIASLPLSPEEKHWKLAKFGARLENPRRRITLAQLQTGFVEGIVTLDYVVQWLEAEGYSPEDQEVLLYETLIKLAAYADKQKAKDTAKSKVKPKPPKKTP